MSTNTVPAVHAANSVPLVHPVPPTVNGDNIACHLVSEVKQSVERLAEILNDDDCCCACTMDKVSEIFHEINACVYFWMSMRAAEQN